MSTNVNTTISKRIVIILIVISILMLPGDLTADDNLARSKRFEKPYKKLAFGKSLINLPDDQSFIELAYLEIPKDHRSYLDGGFGIRMMPKAGPYPRHSYHLRPDVAVRVFVADNTHKDDLIELSWVFYGQHIRAISSINAILFEINVDEIDNNKELDRLGTSRSERTQGLVNLMFRMNGENTHREKYQILISWPDILDNDTKLCSSSGQSIRTLMNWHERIDIFVKNDVLSILSYKKIPQLQFYRDGSKWFPDDFRSLVHERARQLGKMPE